MSRRPARFTEADVKRAVRGALAGCHDEMQVIISLIDGTVRLVPADHTLTPVDIAPEPDADADDRIMQGLGRLDGKKANRRRGATA
jgi:hypothetical protein